ncbi:MAG: hypothetical protein JRG97_00030 [Deltaproteobacteria bacterium]|nr:hypothetical protein [Deltaproteobacteria bacterium]
MMSKPLGRPDLDKLTPVQWEQMGISREGLEKNLMRMQEREKNAPAVGDPAPDFELIRLSSLRGRAAALVFGSYT